MRHDAPIAPAVVEQASEWLMLQWGGDLHGEQRQAFAQWQAADPEHRRAWQRLQHLQQTLGGVPADSARAVLRDTPDTQRRAALKLAAKTIIIKIKSNNQTCKMNLKKRLIFLFLVVSCNAFSQKCSCQDHCSCN